MNKLILKLWLQRKRAGSNQILLEHIFFAEQRDKDALVPRLNWKFEWLFEIDEIILRIWVEVGDHNLLIGVRILPFGTNYLLKLGLFLLICFVIYIHFNRVSLRPHLAKSICQAPNRRQIGSFGNYHVIDVNLQHWVILDPKLINTLHTILLFQHFYLFQLLWNHLSFLHFLRENLYCLFWPFK